MLRVTKINTPQGFAVLRQEWNALLSGLKQQDMLLSHEWFTMCQRWFCRGGALFVLVVHDGLDLVGIAPLQIRTVTRWGISVRQLMFLHEGLPWYRGGFILAGHSDRILMAILAFLREHRQEWDYARFDGVAERSPTVMALSHLATQCGLTAGAWRVFNEPSILPIAGTWEGFLESQGSHFRKNIRNSEHRLQRMGHLEILTVTSPKEVSEYLQVMYDMEVDNHRFQQEQSPESDQVSASAGLYLAGEFAKRGATEVKLLTVDGAPLAGWCSITHHGTSYALVTKHSHRYAKLSPGRVIMYAYVRDTWKSGVERIDYLMKWPYVQRWTSHTERYLGVECFHDGIRSQVLRGAHRIRKMLRRRPVALR